MSKRVFPISLLCLILLQALISCTNQKQERPEVVDTSDDGSFQYVADRFADLQVLRYKVPNFDELTLNQKRLIYYLSQAGLSGRDIFYDQKFKYNLKIRRTIEAIYQSYPGDKTTEDFKAFEVYAKRFWFSNGIHHHYSTQKMKPGFSESYFRTLIEKSSAEALPLSGVDGKEGLIALLTPILFDPNVAAKGVNKDDGVDNIAQSANNFYEGVTEEEVEQFYARKKDPNAEQPPLWGLNTKLVKVDGEIKDRVWKIGGMYSGAIERIVFWLEKAAEVAENPQQQEVINKLITYYKTGDLRDWDEYNIAWVRDTASRVDFINGFIEVYADALGLKGAYESVVSFKDREASQRMAALSENAQWFEDKSPILDEHKKENVTGVSYKVITVVMEVGDAAPSTPVGINLPNSNWIREQYGSKSVSLGNIKDAYNQASSKGTLDEFFVDETRKQRIKQYNVLASNMHTALHEVIGHASGKLEPGVGTPHEELKNYASTLEEARADLVSLYFITDEKLVEMGVMPSTDVGITEYDTYITNGLMLQLRRIDLGDNIEQDHMRNRQLVAKWVYEQGKADNVIELRKINGKTYCIINDYDKLRELFGALLKEIQRIKSEGDFEAGRDLVETYGVKIDQDLHKEVLDRYAKLDAAAYSGFIQPRLIPVEEDGVLQDVKIEYPESFVDQMLEYGKKYSYLPD